MTYGSKFPIEGSIMALNSGLMKALNISQMTFPFTIRSKLGGASTVREQTSSMFNQGGM